MRALALVTIIVSACGGGASTPASTTDAAAIDGGHVPDATAAEPCTALSVLLAPGGGSALRGTPTPGRCEGSEAVSCQRRPDSVEPDRTEGTLARVTCGTGSHCQTFAVDVRISSAPAPLATMTQAACLVDGEPTFAMTWSGTVFAPDTTTPFRCDGTDRLFGAGVEIPEPRFYSISNGPGVPQIYAAGAVIGHYTRASCNVDQHCELLDRTTVCVDDGATACDISICDGNVRHICHNGFTSGTQNCADTGQTCVTADPRAICTPQSEYAAVCAPAGTSGCAGAQADCADSTHYSYCDFDSCLMRLATCDVGQVCNPARTQCDLPANICDPATTVDSCDGNRVRYCGTYNGTRLAFDCAAVGMVCRTAADPTVPGGMRAGCTAEPAASCNIMEPATCAGDSTSWCCAGASDSHGVGSVISAGGAFRCLPGQLVTAPCTACSLSPLSFPICRP